MECIFIGSEEYQNVSICLFLYFHIWRCHPESLLSLKENMALLGSRAIQLVIFPRDTKKKCWYPLQNLRFLFFYRLFFLFLLLCRDLISPYIVKYYFSLIKKRPFSIFTHTSPPPPRSPLSFPTPTFLSFSSTWTFHYLHELFS